MSTSSEQASKEMATNLTHDSSLTSLINAVLNSEEKLVQTLLAEKANLKETTSNGMTALHIAAQAGHVKIVRMLLKNNARVNAPGPRCWTPLHYAAQNGYQEIAEVLIENGAIIESRDWHGRNPLFAAVVNDNLDVLRVLIANIADGNAKNIQERNLLIEAARNNSPNALRCLLDCKADVNWIASYTGSRLLIEAIDAIGKVERIPEKDRMSVGIETVKILINRGVNVNLSARGRIPLLIAIERNLAEIVKLLVIAGADINMRDGLPLATAVKCNCLGILEYLLETGANIDVKFGADINVRDGVPLATAVKCNCLGILEYLLETGANIDVKFFSVETNDNKTQLKNFTLLHLAAERGLVEVVKMLLQYGGNPNAVTDDGQRPIQVALKNRHHDVVEILIPNDFERQYGDKESKFFRDVIRNNTEAVETWLNTGLEVNTRDRKGRTPLNVAIQLGYENMVRVLLKRGADTNLPSFDKMTPLQIASKRGNLQIVTSLMIHGAIFDLKVGGKSPIDYAQDEKILDLLRLVNDAFENVKKNNLKVFDDLFSIIDGEIVEAVFGVKCKEHGTLVATAEKYKFREIFGLSWMAEVNKHLPVRYKWHFLEELINKTHMMKVKFQ